MEARDRLFLYASLLAFASSFFFTAAQIDPSWPHDPNRCIPGYEAAWAVLSSPFGEAPSYATVWEGAELLVWPTNLLLLFAAFLALAGWGKLAVCSAAYAVAGQLYYPLADGGWYARCLQTGYWLWLLSGTLLFAVVTLSTVRAKRRARRGRPVA